MAEAPAIGIDLGTTYACVAVYQHGEVEIIPNDQGKRTTPSYVAFTDTERLIGDAAKNQLAMNPTSTIFDAQRLIGRKFEDASVQLDMKQWPFQLVSDGGKPKLEAKYKGLKKTFFPQEICSMVFIKMKESAEAYTGQTVTDAVITVPACFNYSQRQAIKDSATIAGLNTLRIITSPTAAALSYGLHNNIIEERNILIFDLGGGTCNVSIFTIADGVVEVKSNAGDAPLGGEDFDSRMVNHFVREFKCKFKKDLTTNKRSLGRLRTACEGAKRTLSRSTWASLEIDSLFDDIDFRTSITRARFEEMNADLFHGTLEPVKKSLADTKMDKAEIHDILLIGGSSRIPKIQRLLRDFFNGKELNTRMNPDEAGAYGAAVQAALFMHGDDFKEPKDVLLLDVTPVSLGIETAGGVMTVLIKKGCTVPAKGTCTNDIMVYEGERALTKDNKLLGKIDLTGILPAFCGNAEVEVTFDIDGNGILEVRAIENSTGKESKFMIYCQDRLSKEEIDHMLNEAEKYRTDAEKLKDRFSARNSLESYCFNIKRTAGDVWEKCTEITHWLDANPLAEKEEFEEKQNELEQAWNPIITEMNAARDRTRTSGAPGFSSAGTKRSRLSQN